MSYGQPEAQPISRRDVLRGGAALLAGSLLTACGLPSLSEPVPAPSAGPLAADAAEATALSPLALNPAELTDTPLYGPDTSRVQVDGDVTTGVLDAARMLQEGFSYHLFKGTRGDGSYGVHQDPLMPHSRRQAEDAGLPFGIYHFLEHGNATLQNDRYFDYLESTGGTTGMMHIVDVESYPNEAGVRENSTYEDVLEYCERYRQNTSGMGRLIIYTASWYWGDVKEAGVLGNPAAPPDTELWWCRLVRGNRPNPMGTIQQLDPLVSRPSDADDPWKTEQLGTWAYPAFRQFTFNGLLQQFDGSVRNTGQQYDGTNLKIADLNASFYPLPRLRALAGLAA